MKTWDDRQLKFEIEGLDEVEDDANERLIPPEEAKRISQAARLAFDQLRLGNKKDVEGRGWFDDYLRLMEWGWPWRVSVYIAWASSPKIDRWPETLKDLATDVLGLTGPRVIYVWRGNYPEIDQVVAIMQAAPLWDHRRDVIEALVKSARDPDYKSFNDRKLFLEMIGDYIPKSKLEIGKAIKGGEEELSDEELRATLGEDGLVGHDPLKGTMPATTDTDNEEEGEDAGE